MEPKLKLKGKDQTIGALSTFLQRVEKLGADGKALHFFRGHSRQSYEIKPSIYRNEGWIRNEATMLREVMLRCPQDFAGGMTTFQCLVKMQHYGLPTRLLDVTSNPLVALYFACESDDSDDEDGQVLAFGFDIDKVKYSDSDTVCVLANLSRRPPEFEIPELSPDQIPGGENAFNTQEAIQLLLHDVGSEKPHFLPKIQPKDLQRVVCVKPLLDNPRIIRQEGSFLLFGCDRRKHDPAKLDEAATITRLTINRDEKQNLRIALGRLGITRATLYPEIEHVTEHIKRAYSVPSVEVSKLEGVQLRAFTLLRNMKEYSIPELANELNERPEATRRAVTKLQKIGAITTIGVGRGRRWKLTEKLHIRGGNADASGAVAKDIADA